MVEIRRKVTLAFVGMLIVTMLAVGYAAVLMQKSFTNTATIGVVGNISLWQNSACTIPLTAYDWGSVWAANATVEKDVYIKNQGNTVAYIGWTATGFPQYDAATHFFHDGGTPFALSTCNFYFYMKQGGAQWNDGTGTLKSLAVGAVLYAVAKLSTGYYPIGGSSVSFTVTVTAYDSPSG